MGANLTIGRRSVTFSDVECMGVQGRGNTRVVVRGQGKVAMRQGKVAW